tara:strand:+ start:77 stop:370 length:294 start_codon:yes stop_codon:yes gene_type:complete
MSDKEKDEEIMHEVLLPDNTYSVFCTYDPELNELQIYDGAFNCSDLMEEIGISMRTMLESVVVEAQSRLKDVNVKPIQRVEKISGNVVYANFNKRMH